MAKSSRRDTSAGALDGLAGRAMEAWGKLTGRRSKNAKGKATRARGKGRRVKGRAKRAAR